MKIEIRIILVTLSIILSGQSYAYSVKDTTQISLMQEDMTDFNNDLDSLLASWYISKAQLLSADTLDIIPNSYFHEFNDSLIKQQLAEIVSPFSLDYNKRVKAFINLYINKRREQMAYMLGLSDYYFPMIEEAFDRYDIPLELKYLAVIESALNPRAVSRVGATGLWQFMYSTGKIYKLEINSYVDDRRNPIEATEAAAKFLKNLYDIYGDWTLVIAAYNCGPGNVNKAIRRSGGKRNFWEIYYRLPRETRGYVPAFIAVTYAFHHYKEYGIKPVPMDLPMMTDTMQISKNLHLKQVSEVLNLPVELLRELNPQYKKDIIPARASKSYQLVIPQSFSMAFIDQKNAIFNHKHEVYFSEKKVIAPKKYEYGGHVAINNKHLTPLKYTIKSGDNLGYISSWYNVKIRDIKYWNNIYKNRIRAGKTLMIYVPKSKAKYYADINDLSFEEKQARVGKKTRKTFSKVKPKYDKNAEYIVYKVKRGDNLWTIARKYSGVSNTDIMHLNGITDPSSLRPGQRLRIKKKS